MDLPSSCKEWLERSGFEITDNISAEKGDISVKFVDNKIMSITLWLSNNTQQVLLSLEDISIYIFSGKSNIVFL